MKYKYLLSAAICLMLTACAAQTPPEAPPEPPIESPAITVAPIEGDAVSPDGKWEIVQEGVNEGITSGGLYPCETVKIVNRDSGEVLWEEDGAYLIHAAWQRDSKFAVVARTARTWTQVTVISTGTGAACPVLLPGDKPIPDYTFLAEDWIGWAGEDSFELRLDGDGGIEYYRCYIGENPSGESLGFPRELLEIVIYGLCYEKVPGEYDFTHDGQPEKVELVTMVGDDGRDDGELRPIWYELHVSDQRGKLLWTRGAHMAHMGWANLFACRIEGYDYILDYNPYVGQGYGSYSYSLFWMDENGEVQLLKENSVGFDINFDTPIFTDGYDPAAIGAFMDDVHGYLEGDCDLLISTQDFNTVVFGSGTDFRGDDFTGGELYAYDGTWEERFIHYREEKT